MYELSESSVFFFGFLTKVVLDRSGYVVVHVGFLGLVRKFVLDRSGCVGLDIGLDRCGRVIVQMAFLAW